MRFPRCSAIFAEGVQALREAGLVRAHPMTIRYAGVDTHHAFENAWRAHAARFDTLTVFQELFALIASEKKRSPAGVAEVA